MAHTEKESIYLDLQELRKTLRKAGYEMEARNRVDYLIDAQHEVEGVNALGNTIKMGRVYPSRRIVGRAFQNVKNYNRCARPDKLESFLSSVNSYIGIFKRRNAYGVTRRLMDTVAPGWWEYCHFNDGRKCLSPNDGYRHFDLIARRYKLKYYGKSRTTQCA